MRALPVFVALAGLAALAGCASSDAAHDPTMPPVDTVAAEMRADAAGCYRNLPAPRIATAYAFSTPGFDDYAIHVTNWTRFPDELFVAAPACRPAG
jgi:hypothetical protein